MYTRVRIFWLLALMSFVLQIGISSAGEKVTPLGEDLIAVDLRDGRLRVSVENQKFQRVMDEVAQKAGIGIVINDPAKEDLTIHFDYLPLEKGLKKLLRGRNYVFFYRSVQASQPPKLTRILILPQSKGGTVTDHEGMVRNRLVKKAKQKGNMLKVLNLDEKKLEEVLRGFSQEGVDLKKEFYDALQSIQEMEGFEEMIQLGEVLQGFSQGGGNTVEEEEVIMQKQKAISLEKREGRSVDLTFGE